MTPAEQVSAKIIELQERLLAKHPTMPVLLREIHKELLANPDVVTLLSNEERSVIISGLENYTRTDLIVATKGSSKKAISKMTLVDL